MFNLYFQIYSIDIRLLRLFKTNQPTNKKIKIKIKIKINIKIKIKMKIKKWNFKIIIINT